MSPTLFLFLVSFYFKFDPTGGHGNLPDASQEGILKQLRSYDDMALFHYTVPPDTTRATWEFASFQDVEDCPGREVLIYLQHGSFPVVEAANASFQDNVYTPRTERHFIKTRSAYKPHDSTIFPIYNPLPGSWYAFAYLSPFEEKITQQGLLHKCRYSLGSIALWTKADQVELIIPFVKKEYQTRKHFSYFKFYVPENVASFKLNISDCTIRHQIKERIFGRKDCIEYANLRARGLPRHDPHIGGATNLTEGSHFSFEEGRPYAGSHYYLLIVSTAVVTFNIELIPTDCGESGLYGRSQSSWYLTQAGLKFNTSNVDRPKENLQLSGVS